MIRDLTQSAPIELRIMWAAIHYNLTALHASAKVETKVAATHLIPHGKDR
jgi:hypothetical protein